MAEHTIQMQPSAELADILDLVKAVDRKRPDPDSMSALRAQLDAHPDVCRELGGLDRLVQANITQKTLPKSVQLATLRRADLMREDLGYRQSSELERLLIDHVITCWLRMQQAELRYTAQMAESLTLAQGDYWDRHLAAVQRRYLRACETLARVRKMRPTLQVNIAQAGGQQVNVAGDMEVKRE